MRLSDHVLRRVGYTFCVVSMAAAPVSMTLAARAGVLGGLVENYIVPNAVTGLLYGALGLLLVRFELRNLLTWLVVGSAICQACPALLTSISELVASNQGVPLEQLDVASLPPGATTVIGLAAAVWTFPFVGVPTIGLLLVPDGRLLSRRWLPVAAYAAVASVVMWVIWGTPWPLEGPDAAASHSAAVQAVAGILFLAWTPLLLLCYGSLILRYRRSNGSDRRRLRWMLVGAGVYVAALVAGFATGGGEPALLIPILMISLSLAIWRDQLFDVDVVISRALLFGSLAAFIGAVYVGIVYGIGAVIGQTGGGNQGLSLLATVVVAFAFQPTRRRLERAANRLVYGRRASPYEVLSDLSSRLGMAEASSGLLDRMVERLADGTGADQAALWRARQGAAGRAEDESQPGNAGCGFEAVAVWPSDVDLAPIEQLPLDAVPIERSGVQLGALTVTKRRGEDLNQTERRLMRDLAGSAGLVLDRARLDIALEEQAAALFRSRRRLVGAQDEERHRLEEQLEAGTQQQLDHLAAKLGANAALAARAGLAPAGDQLAALAMEARTAKAEIRALARGVYPPVLEAGGLAAAVESLAASLPITVEVHSTVSRRFELDTELALYFCIAEALTNVVKHAETSAASVRLDHSDQLVWFDVVDDGIGMPSTINNGFSTGILGLTDRIEAVGGRLKITSRAGHGTTVHGSAAINALAGVK